MNAHSLEQELERLLQRFNANPEGRIFAPLADCYRKLGRLGEALRVCESGLGRHPDYSSALVILGKIHLDRGDLESAAGAFRRVLEMDPHNLVAVRQLAQVAGAQGDVEAARDAWGRLVSLDPHAEDAREHLERLSNAVDATATASPAPAEPPAAEPFVEPTPPVAEVPHAPEEREAAVTATSELAEAGEQEGESRARAQEGEADAEVPAAPATAEDPATGVERASQIATMTLADIYYEQGFKAKALEIYRTVLRDNPRTPGIAEKVERIENELHHIQGRLGPAPELPPQASLAELESEGYGDGVLSAGIAEEPATDESTASVPTAGPPVAEEDDDEGGDEAVPPQPPAPPRHSSPFPLDDDTDFQNFRSWLGRIKARPL